MDYNGMTDTRDPALRCRSVARILFGVYIFHSMLFHIRPTCFLVNNATLMQCFLFASTIQI